MDAKEFERELLLLLQLQFAGPNDPGLTDRRRKLIRLFQSLTDPVLKTIYYARLSTPNARDELVNEFQHRLATATREQLLQIILSQPVETGPRTPANGPTLKRFRLIDEDHSTERWITQEDAEFLDYYIDFNIAGATSDPDPRTLRHHTMVVKYGHGRTLEFSMSAVPVRHVYTYGSARMVTTRFQITPDAYLRERGSSFLLIIGRT